MERIEGANHPDSGFAALRKVVGMTISIAGMEQRLRVEMVKEEIARKVSDLVNIGHIELPKHIDIVQKDNKVGDVGCVIRHLEVIRYPLFTNQNPFHVGINIMKKPGEYRSWELALINEFKRGTEEVIGKELDADEIFATSLVVIDHLEEIAQKALVENHLK